MNLPKIEATKKELTSFGWVIGIALGLIGLLSIYLNGWVLTTSPMILWAVGGAFLIAGLTVPIALKPFYIPWMWLATLLNWVVTRVILFLFFALLITPLGTVMRLFGHDPMRKKSPKNSSESLWIPKESDPRGTKHFESPY